MTKRSRQTCTKCGRLFTVTGKPTKICFDCDVLLVSQLQSHELGDLQVNREVREARQQLREMMNDLTDEGN